MAKIDHVLMKAKFRGSMLGSLLGDCFGGPFEGDAYTLGMRTTVQKCFDKLDGPPFKAPFKPYSDDTAMTKSVATCLIEKPAVDYKYMAKLFVNEYFRDPKRGYGENVVDVFYKLKMNKFEDIDTPAREQFRGSGSFGNGGAMRVAPIALFFQNDYNAMVIAARKATEITHTNILGVNGALLQCMAVQQSLHLNPGDTLDPSKFTEDLIEKIKEFETPDVTEDKENPTPYQSQLSYIQKLLKSDTGKNPLTIEEVIGCLGNSVAALHSVPTAIYCFLKAQSGFPGIETDNIFRRAIQYAVTLGGDTDTIASMTGAIAGAYYGENGISQNMLSHCEFRKETEEMADNLYDAIQNDNQKSDVA